MAHSPVLALQPGSAPAASVQALPFMRAAVPIAIMALIALSAALRFANLSAIGDANLYYTAAVTSMLQSPANFFFAAAEPGGAVTVDKPPVGLWLQTLSAAVFGVSGAAVALPQILASIACVPLIFLLVRRHFGAGAGLIAAAVVAVMPIDIATARNNTMDMTLVFTLLLAAWAYLRATETGQLRWLIVGGVLVGIGFNIKMLQAFLPVPAFFALYLLGARLGWGRKLRHLAIGGAVLLAVSLSWALIVDAIPADQRPYIGSSSTNSVLELIIGYNGISRLLGNNAGGAGVQTGGAPIGGMFGGETGEPGIFRLFAGALGNESGWLLPVSLIGLCLIIAGARLRLPLLPRHQGAVLWGGWLLTAVIFFSRAEFFHAYYLVMLTPPIAALTGAGLAIIGGWAVARPRLAGLLAAGLAGAGVGYQVWLAQSYLGDTASAWLPVLALPALLAIAAFVIALVRARPSLAIALASAALFVIPAAWGVATTANASPNTTLPSAFEGAGNSGDLRGGRMPVGTPPAGAGASGAVPTPPAGGRMPISAPGMGSMGGMGVDETLLTYLEENTAETRYLMAVSSSMVGAPYIIATGRPVLYTGGFSGTDPVADADDLAALVAAGELRYVLWTNTRGLPGMMMNIVGGAGGGMTPPDTAQRPANMLRAAGGMMGGDAAISAWLTSACTPVEDMLSGLNMFTLYDCVGGES